MKRKTSLANRIIVFFGYFLKHKKTGNNYIEDVNNPVIIELSSKPKNRSVVSVEYGVTVKVLNKWFEEKNLNIPQGIICPADLRTIYATLGIPKNIIMVKE